MSRPSENQASRPNAPTRASRVQRRSIDTDELLRQRMEATPDLIFVHRDGIGLFANRSAREALSETARDEVCQQRGRVRVVRIDGRARVVEVASLPLLFGGALATAVVAHDVTAFCEEEAKVLRIDRMEALGTLAAGIASEVSDPLTTVVVNVEHVARRLRALLATRDASEIELTGLVDALAHALDGAGRIRHLVRDLTALSHGSVDRHGLVDLRSVLESAVQTAAHVIRGRARLVRSLRDVPPVEGNESRLGQLFLSLLINAAQSIPEGSAATHEVRVSTHTDDAGCAVIEIADTGRGIAPEVLPRIFDPFFTTRKGVAGPGLGLSLAHGTVQSMDGEMTVESTLGCGSVVRIILPAAPSWESRGMRRTVLILDSDPSVAMAIARALEEEHDALLAEDAADAIRRIELGEHFDAIVCDVCMPEVSGIEFYTEVLRRAPTLAAHIVFLTCGALPPRARAFAESLGTRCLEKPPDMTKLRELIRKAARERRSSPASRGGVI